MALRLTTRSPGMRDRTLSLTDTLSLPVRTLCSVSAAMTMFLLGAEMTPWKEDSVTTFSGVRRATTPWTAGTAMTP